MNKNTIGYVIAFVATVLILWCVAVAWDEWGYRDEQDSSPEAAAHYSGK